MTKKRLRRKVLGGLNLFALVVILATTILLGRRYVIMKYEDYRDTAFSYARTAAKLIDGEKALGYLESGEADEYYDSIQRYLETVRKETDIEYYYVFVPTEEGMHFIWDTDDSEERIIGDFEPYDEGDKEAIERVLLQEPEEELQFSDGLKYGFLLSAYAPIPGSDGKPAAVVGVDYSATDVVIQIIMFVLANLATILIITIAAEIICYFIVNRRLIYPIRLLTKAADDVVENLDAGSHFRVDVDTGDELEDLAAAFAQMDGGLRKYVRRLSAATAERERMLTELSVAARIQNDMLPQIFPPFPDRKEFSVYAAMKPAREVGGDFYDFFLIDEDHLGLVIADVSGKGIPASLFMMRSKTLIQSLALPGKDPGEVLTGVNEILCGNNDAEMFVTVWFAVLELSTGRGVAANAGHEHPAVRRADGPYELDVYRHSPALGVISGIRVRSHEFRLMPGDEIFVYTDGIPEAVNDRLEAYGTERMLRALNKKGSVSPEDRINDVQTSADSFAGGTAQFDDMTTLCLQYFGPGDTDPAVTDGQGVPAEAD